MTASEDKMNVDIEWLDAMKEQAKEAGATELTVYWCYSGDCYTAEWIGNTLQEQFLEQEEYGHDYPGWEGTDASYLEEFYDEGNYLEQFTLSL